MLRRDVRATDTAARVGGDEFLVLLPETLPEGAFVVAENIRRGVAVPVRVEGLSLGTTASVGLVSYPEDGHSVEELVANADKAMYQAKTHGKDRIMAYRTERIPTAGGAPRGPRGARGGDQPADGDAPWTSGPQA